MLFSCIILHVYSLIFQVLGILFYYIVLYYIEFIIINHLCVYKIVIMYMGLI